MREQLANSEIERYEEGINTAEKDAIRNLKMQGLMNMGTSAAMAGKDAMVGQQTDAQLIAMMTANPDFDFKFSDPTGKFKWLKRMGITPQRKKALGGKIRRAK